VTWTREESWARLARQGRPYRTAEPRARECKRADRTCIRQPTGERNGTSAFAAAIGAGNLCRSTAPLSVDGVEARLALWPSRIDWGPAVERSTKS
jgi:hypothetical protein